ncbi:MAG: hypothetical protein MJA31_17175, partial [Clostridia bacterium]|nr:hypothetical protein [Clostridia bacterium]
ILKKKYGHLKLHQFKDGIVELVILKESFLSAGSCFEIVDTAERILKRSIEGIDKVVLISDW